MDIFVKDDQQAIDSVVKILIESNSAERKSEIFRSLTTALSQPAGRPRIFDCLTEWTARTKARYRFQPLINEINLCDTLEYGQALITFLNSLISTCNDREDRIRTRNEFLGLKLQSALDKLRSLANNDKNDKNSELLLKQLAAFDELRLFDDVGEMTGSQSVDLNSHADIFYAILKQVSQTPNEILFLNILQHLLQIDPGETVSDYVWEAVEKLVCRAKLLDSKEEAEKMLRPHSSTAIVSANVQQPDDVVQNRTGCHCSCHRQNAANLVAPSESTSRIESGSNNPLPPTPPPPPPQLAFATGRKAARNSSFTNFTEAINKTTLRKTPAMTTSTTTTTTTTNPNPDTTSYSDSSHPSNTDMNGNPKVAAFVNQQQMQSLVGVSANVNPINPVGKKPKQKLKQFAWNKVPIAKVVSNRDNIWIKAARSFNDDYSPDFDTLEELFCQCSPPNTMERRASSSPSSSPYSNGNGDRKKRDSMEINLLDPKRSLNVNIFLRQFRGDIKDFTKIIETGNGAKIGLEKLRSLMKIMPELDEVESLSSYSEDKSKLGSAERFFMTLIDIPHYRLRVESMLLKEEFSTLVDYIKPSVEIILKAAQELKSNSSLHEVMYLVLMIGNYLNSGTYGGNAVGFKMTSLWKLVEIRANKPNVTLLHYVVMEVEKKNSSLLEFPKEMKYVEEASKLPIETVATDYRVLKEKTERISKQLQNANCLALSIQMNDFLEYAKSELSVIEQQMKAMERLRLELALFLCEDPQAFKLEDCFKIFYNFSLRFNKAIDENNERKVQEEKFELRRKQTEQEKAKAKDSISNVIRRRSTVIDSDEQQSIIAEIIDNRRPDVLSERDKVLAEKRRDFDSGVNLSSKPKVLLDNATTTAVLRKDKNENVVEISCENAKPTNEIGGFKFEEVGRKSVSSRRRLSGAPIINDRDRPSSTLRDGRFHSIDGGVLQSAAISPEKNTSTSGSSTFTECSPIFAKPFLPTSTAKVETARISSVSDLRLLRPTLIVTSSSSFGRGLDAIGGDSLENGSNTVGGELENFANRFGNSFTRRSTVAGGWFDRNRKRSNSLHLLTPQPIDVNSKGDCAGPGDLNDLLSTLETEKQLNDLGRRRIQRHHPRRFTNSYRDESSCFVSDGDVGEFKPSSSFWRKNFNNETAFEFAEKINNNDRMEQSTVVDAESNMQISVVAGSSSIKDYTDNNNKTIELNDYDKLSNDLVISSNKNVSNTPDSLVVSKSIGVPPILLSSAGTSKITESKSAWHSYSDQSDARSTESPTESVCERDEGFETESHSTICSEQPLTPLSPILSDNVSSSGVKQLLSSPSPETLTTAKKENNANTIIFSNKTSSSSSSSTAASVVVNRKEHRINVPKFMTGTKASLARAMTSSSTASKEPSQPQPKAKPAGSSGVGGNFVKRMIESISNKKSAVSKFPSPKVMVKRKQATDSLPQVTSKGKKESPGIAQTGTLRRSSSSSLSNSPGRNNVIRATNVIELPVVGEKVAHIAHSSQTKNTKNINNSNNYNNANKQRIMQMRSRLKAAKETGSSSDSDKGPPPRRVPPRTLKTLAAKNTSNNPHKISAPANDIKTWERLKSPPKSPAKASSDHESRGRHRDSNRRLKDSSSVASFKSKIIVQNGRRSSSDNNENSIATKPTSKPWR